MPRGGASAKGRGLAAPYVRPQRVRRVDEQSPGRIWVLRCALAVDSHFMPEPIRPPLPLLPGSCSH